MYHKTGRGTRRRGKGKRGAGKDGTYETNGTYVGAGGKAPCLGRRHGRTRPAVAQGDNSRRRGLKVPPYGEGDRHPHPNPLPEGEGV